MRLIRIFLIICLFQAVCLFDVYAESLEQIFNKANEQYDKKDYEGALVEYRKVVNLLKKDGNFAGAQKIQKTVGDLNYELGKYVDAVTEYNAALALNKTIDPELKAKILIKLGNAHYKQNHFALASKTFEEVLKPGVKITPEQRIDITCDLADTYRKNEIYSKAIKYYQEALKSPPIQSDPQRQSFILTATGLSLAKLGNFDEAISNLQKALGLSLKLTNPQNTAEIYSNIGIVYWDRGDYPKALENIKKAQVIEQQNNLQKNQSADYNNEGLVYKSAGNLNKALGSLDQSIVLAQTIKYEQGEAIATANKAIVKKLQGNYGEAMKDFEKALEIYNRIKLQQGIAVCYQEIGNLYEIDKQDYKKASEYYQKAFDIYNQLGLVSYQANVLNDLGSVFKKGINRQRTTRDLIFEDNAPVFIDMQAVDAKKKSIENYEKALALATKIGVKEDIWTAHQGLGYSLMQDGKQEEAFKHYKAAIDTVLSMKGGKSDSELMGNYLKNKISLFSEAIGILTDLYAKNKNPEYLRLQSEYQEIYKNEIMKNAMATANITFEDRNKAKLSTDINETLSQKNKLEQLKAQYQNTDLTNKDDQDAAQVKKDIDKETAEIQAKLTKIEGSVNDQIKAWGTQYPNDVGMFDSASKVDFNSIQKNLRPDQAVIQYFPTADFLSIICITKEGASNAQVPITRNELAQEIRDNFHSVMEKRKNITEEKEEIKYFLECNKTLNKLYSFLITPIEKQIENKSKLIIIPNDYISYVPFSALVKDNSNANDPRYLVYEKAVSYMRLSFLKQNENFAESRIDLKTSKILAFGNPSHKYLRPALPSLGGAENEIGKLVEVIKDKGGEPPETFILEKATEKAFREKTSQTQYNIFYFATHGVPYAEILFNKAMIAKSVTKWNQTGIAKDAKKNGATVAEWDSFVSYSNEVFDNKSPLYGFIYLSTTDDIEKNREEGVLTLGKILAMPEAVFKNAQLAVLSACNTAVSYSPKVSKEVRSQMENKAIYDEVSKTGWTPGVDQVCLVDTFMKRNFKAVLGTFWMADDGATAFIVNRFMKHLDGSSPSDALAKAQRDFLNERPLDINYTKTPIDPYFWAVAGMFGQ